MTLLIFMSVLLVFMSTFIVFGGGQIFIPVFSWIFTLLSENFGAHIDSEIAEKAFAVMNATPGIFGTKVALFTGYLISNDATQEGQWWGFITMIITYLCAVIPSILIMHLAMKLCAKNKNNVYFIAINKYMKPVMSAIVIGLAIQLFIGTLLPYVTFNKSDSYFLINTENVKSKVFSEWRLYALYAFVPMVIIATIVAQRKKIPLLYTILIAIVLALVIFQPWSI
ncbi:chromate transporter [Mycoplasma phocoenae]|uniref:Chromate transporter n=1 Tax=Mycoplasma phocoenae TaxID=754517 RepID=A0A858U850_9MOLU|nr:chromate transporter [Mycoplasma phocoenae]QJG66906.1 chromate transporter [Mycoplasma phocoenae]